MVAKWMVVLLAALTLCSCGGGESLQTLDGLRDASGKDKGKGRWEAHAPLILAKAGAAPREGKCPLNVQLFDNGSSSADGIVKWEWNTGSGWQDCTASQGQYSCTFKNPKTNVAHLRVTDSRGRKDTDAVRVRLNTTTNSAPTAVASSDVSSGMAPLVVNFSADGSLDPDGALSSWEWDFGFGYIDFSESAGAAIFTYDEPGEYTATLRVTDNDGAQSTASLSVSVDTPANEPPLAVASCDPSSGRAPLAVNFSAAGSNDPDGELVAWEWDFGSGFEDHTATLGETARTYGTAGDYTATLRVTDNGGTQATAEVTLSVTAPPPPPPPPSSWTHSYGLALDDEAYSTVVDAQGNVYVAGRHVQNNGSGNKRSVLLLKYASDGSLLWAKTFGGSGASSFVDTTVNGMALDPLTGGVVVAMTSNELSVGGTDFVVAKFGPNGLTYWSRSWGGSGSETAAGVSVDSFGQVYACGASTGFGGGAECALIKMNEWGDLLWQRLWGSAGNEYGVDVAADGSGVYMLGDTDGLPLLQRYASSGALQWTQAYNGGGVASSLELDGTSVLVGGSRDGNLFAARFDGSGLPLWASSWGNGAMSGSAVVGTPTGVAMAGTLGENALLARFDADGSFAAASQRMNFAGEVRGFGLAYGAGALHWVGSAPSAAGTNSAASGSFTSLSVSPFVPAGSGRAPFGASTWQFGLEEEPAGVQDAGAGGQEMLVVKGAMG